MRKCRQPPGLGKDRALTPEADSSVRVLALTPSARLSLTGVGPALSLRGGIKAAPRKFQRRGKPGWSAPAMRMDFSAAFTHPALATIISS